MVDSNVLIDVTAGNPTWEDRSSSRIKRLADEALLLINPLIFAEVSIGFDSIEALDDALPTDLYQRVELPYEAAFLAGKAFRDYRRAGTSKLTDAGLLHWRTRCYRRLPPFDARPARYRTYFPRLELIAPE